MFISPALEQFEYDFISSFNIFSKDLENNYKYLYIG